MHSLDSWFDYYKDKEEEDKHKKISGVLACFCESEFKRLSFSLIEMEYRNDKYIDGVAICDEWLVD